MAWYGDSRGFYGDEMIFVVGASMRMLVTGGNECTNAGLPNNYVIPNVSIILRY